MGGTETEFEIVNSILTGTIGKVVENSSQLRGLWACHQGNSMKGALFNDIKGNQSLAVSYYRLEALVCTSPHCLSASAILDFSCKTWLGWTLPNFSEKQPRWGYDGQKWQFADVI
jgi:hypothetical protein